MDIEFIKRQLDSLVEQLKYKEKILDLFIGKKVKWNKGNDIGFFYRFRWP